jgi:hypothetical protein
MVQAPNFVEDPFLKLSEKGRRGLQRVPTDHPKTLYVLRILPKSALRVLLKSLFGRFL